MKTRSILGAVLVLGLAANGLAQTWPNLSTTYQPAMTADPAGVASFTGPVPAGPTGLAIWLYAFDLGSLTFSNGLAAVIG